MQLATVIGPRALVTQPIDFRALLLYYMVAVAITIATDARGTPPKIHPHVSSGRCRAAS